MADERMRERERRAKLGGLEEREAWLVDVVRTCAPEAQDVDALRARIADGLEALRRAIDARFAAEEGESAPKPCPTLSIDPVFVALETALRDRDGMTGAGYGIETLVTYWPREERQYDWFQVGVFALVARLGDEVTLAASFGVASKPTPGSAWTGLSGWRESLRPATKEEKLRAWTAAGSQGGVWETLSLEKARLAVDIPRARAGALKAPAPIAKKGDVTWRGVVRGIQPRVELKRIDGDDRHFGAGYALRLEGAVDGVERELLVGIGEAAQEQHGFRSGDVVSGVAKPVEDPTVVPVDFYRASKLVLEARGPKPPRKTPPWHGAPELTKLRAQPRPLADDALASDPCRVCSFGCRVQVSSVPGHDRPFVPTCFGPTSCPAYVSPDGAVAAPPRIAKKTTKKTTKKEKARRR